MTYRWLTVGALAVCLAACSRPPKQASNLKPAPDFSLKDATGQTVKLSDFRGKVVLLNFWATWCGPCKIEIPWFISFQQQFKDRDFAVMGISLDEDGWDSVKPYIAQAKINYRIMIGNDQIDKAYGGLESLPTTFVIDRGGKIASKHVGLVSKSTYESEIERLLNSKETRTPTPSRGVLAFIRPATP